jgi:uncharacterized protein with NAD-binding domain and iron-sulfur cluster
MGSLSAVYALTSRPNWQDEFDITVYQLGWRLGGKAASGRDAAEHDRSLEHGYHVLLGFYDNAFATMREVYRELGRPPEAPLSAFCADTVEEERAFPRRFAVRRHLTCQVAQSFGGKTYFLPFDLPANHLVPGDGAKVDPWTALGVGFDTLLRAATGRLFEVGHEAGTPTTPPRPTLAAWMLDALEHLIQTGETEIDRWLSQPALIETAHAVWQKLAASPVVADGLRAASRLIVKLLQAYMRRLWVNLAPKIHDDWPSYRDWIVQDTITANLCGILSDDVLTRGFTHLNDVNYVDWWMRHAAVAEGALVTAQSSLGQFPYDLVFGYRDGDASSPPGPGKPMRGSPDMEAGTMLIGLFYFLLGYKGAPEWMPQAGFGEVLVAPLYEVLRRRGVRFEFFHRVRQLHLDDARQAIARIEIERQATVISGVYEPLRPVNGLPCWPSQPFYDQLVEGTTIRSRGVNLESWWTDWRGAPVELQRGRDFDDVLLGISIAALPELCGELIAARPEWRAMVEKIRTNRPLIVQTWQQRTIADLGFPYGVINGDIGTQPINLLTSMDQILPFETWPANGAPRSLVYYSGVMPDDPNQPPAPNPAYPPTQQAELRNTAIAFLERSAGVYLPGACPGGRFDWNVLACAGTPPLEGPARFDAQYWRVNIDPSERYVLSVTGSSSSRLAAGGSGFDNLFLAGDWIETGLNAGCMEATVTSGLDAARAMTAARPFVLRGERSWRGAAAIATPASVPGRQGSGS